MIVLVVKSIKTNDAIDCDFLLFSLLNCHLSNPMDSHFYNLLMQCNNDQRETYVCSHIYTHKKISDFYYKVEDFTRCHGNDLAKYLFSILYILKYLCPYNNSRQYTGFIFDFSTMYQIYNLSTCTSTCILPTTSLDLGWIHLPLYMPPAPALPAAKVLDAFADCRRQSQTGKTGKRNWINLPFILHKNGQILWNFVENIFKWSKK